MEKIRELSIDLETYSDVDIGKCGGYKYAESLSFEILLFGVSVNNGPVISFPFSHSTLMAVSLSKPYSFSQFPFMTIAGVSWYWYPLDLCTFNCLQFFLLAINNSSFQNLFLYLLLSCIVPCMSSKIYIVPCLYLWYTNPRNIIKELNCKEWLKIPRKTIMAIQKQRKKLIEYSCAVTPQVRQTGNRLSGLAGTAYASLLA